VKQLNSNRTESQYTTILPTSSYHHRLENTNIESKKQKQKKQKTQKKNEKKRFDM